MEERALMIAVLADALEIIFSDRAPDWFTKKVRAKTIRWVIGTNDDSDRVFSFHQVCESLGINPNYLRSKIAAKMGIELSPLRAKYVLPCAPFRQKGASAEEDFDWNSMYKLGSLLHMAGYREKPLEGGL